MPYILRDQEGRVSAVFSRADPNRGATEEVPPGDPEVSRFLGSNGLAAEVMEELAETDRNMARITEDLVQALVSKGLILFTDLPHAARRKLMERRRLRERMNPLAGMIRTEEDDTI